MNDREIEFYNQGGYTYYYKGRSYPFRVLYYLKSYIEEGELNDIVYYIKEQDGYVIVFESDERTVYEYTSIRVDELPEKMQESIKKGIKVDSLSQIYGFLENYSS